MGGMNVYFVRAVIDGKPRIKIGKANDVKARVGHLQTSSPVELKLVGEISCGSEIVSMKVERFAHDTFKPFRRIGEWFDLPSGWREYLSRIKEKADQLIAEIPPQPVKAIVPAQPLTSKFPAPEATQSAGGFSRGLPNLWTDEQVAEYFSVSTETLARERRCGNIRYTMIAKRIRFTDEHILEYLKANEVLEQPQDESEAATGDAS